MSIYMLQVASVFLLTHDSTTGIDPAISGRIFHPEATAMKVHIKSMFGALAHGPVPEGKFLFIDIRWQFAQILEILSRGHPAAPRHIQQGKGRLRIHQQRRQALEQRDNKVTTQRFQMKPIDIRRDFRRLDANDGAGVDFLRHDVGRGAELCRTVHDGVTGRKQPGIVRRTGVEVVGETVRRLQNTGRHDNRSAKCDEPPPRSRFGTGQLQFLQGRGYVLRDPVAEQANAA